MEALVWFLFLMVTSFIWLPLALLAAAAVLIVVLLFGVILALAAMFAVPLGLLSLAFHE